MKKLYSLPIQLDFTSLDVAQCRRNSFNYCIVAQAFKNKQEYISRIFEADFKIAGVNVHPVPMVKLTFLESILALGGETTQTFNIYNHTHFILPGLLVNIANTYDSGKLETVEKVHALGKFNITLLATGLL